MARSAPQFMRPQELQYAQGPATYLTSGAHLYAAADAARPAQVLVELHHGGCAAARALHEVADNPAAALARDAAWAFEATS